MLLEEQDRSLWDQDQIELGLSLVERALRLGQVGPFQLQAAIAAVHAEAPTSGDVSWEQIAALYGELHQMQPTPIVLLNRAVAVAMWQGAEEGLALIDPLRAELNEYQFFHSARASLLKKLGRTDESRAAYQRALELAGSAAEQRFLSRRLSEVGAGS